jgi:hypothetical protein
MAAKPRHVVQPIRSARAGIVLAAGVVVLALLTSPAAGARPANPGLWSALGDKLICGVAAHAPGAAGEVLCADRVFPAPKGPAVDGDPGFVYLAAHGRAHLARLSQYSWQEPDGWDPSHRATLKPGERWRHGGVTCSVHRTSVRCTNHSHHGFTVTLSRYRAF